MWEAARRGWFGAFQPNARWGSPEEGRRFSAPAGMLANNVISDPASCSLWFYADQALWTPRLAPGVSIMDAVRDTLDWWLDERMRPAGRWSATGTTGLPGRQRRAAHRGVGLRRGDRRHGVAWPADRAPGVDRRVSSPGGTSTATAWSRRPERQPRHARRAESVRSCLVGRGQLRREVRPHERDHLPGVGVPGRPRTPSSGGRPSTTATPPWPIA